MNWIFEYNRKIQSEEILTSKKVKAVYQKLVNDLTTNTKWEYNEKKANHAINFIEYFCKHSKGEWAGKPVLLELWQKAFVAALFGIVNKITQKRRFRKALLIVAKKNGKSLLASAILLYMLVADGEGGAECYSVATKKEQAKIIFGEAAKMVKASPALAKYIKCKVNQICFDATNSVAKPLSSDSNTEDGLNVYLGECDEIHAWQTTDLYNIVADGTSAREEPIILLTTTAGFIREGLYDKEYDEATNVINGIAEDDNLLAVIYELDSRDEWQDSTKWIKANPNLGISKKIEYLEHKVKNAQINPTDVKNVLTKEFNIRETSTDVWLNFEDIENKAKFDITELKPDYCFAGADLSKNTDLTSACVLFMVPNSDIIYVQSMYWLPSELLEKRVKEDNMKYDIWHEQGLLRVSNGNKVDYDDVVDWFVEIQNDYGCYLYQHCYDSWSSTAYIKRMNEEFGDISVPIIQGKKTLSGPMMQLGEDIKSKRINYNYNPLTLWCLTNVMADVDKNGNIQPAKTINQRRRIDGFAAMLNAYVGFVNERSDYMRMINR